MVPDSLRKYYNEANSVGGTPSHQKPEMDVMGLLDLLFSIHDPDLFAEKKAKYGLYGDAPLDVKPGWATDIWDRLNEIKGRHQGIGTDGALRALNGHVLGQQSLLRPDFLQHWQGASAEDQKTIAKAYLKIQEKSNDVGIDPNLIANMLWDPSTQALRADKARRFIGDVNKLNEVTDNTALSILVHKSGGLSREKTEKDPAFKGLLDRVLEKLQDAENNQNKASPQTLSYADIRADAPAHKALIREALEDMGEGHLMVNLLKNSSDMWPLEQRDQSQSLMKGLEIDVPTREIELTQQWKIFVQPPEVQPAGQPTSPAQGVSSPFVSGP